MEFEYLSWWNVGAILVGAYILVFAGFLRKRLRQKHKSLPPGHMGWPLIGNTVSFLRAYKSQNPYSFLNNLKQRYGATGIYKSNLFWNPTILVCSPELCRKVFTDEENFASGYNLSDVVFGGQSLDITAGRPGHKRFRRLTTGGINGPESLSSYIESIEKVTIDTLEELAKLNEPIEFGFKTKAISFKVIMNIYLGFVGDDSIMESLNKSYEYLFRGLFSAPINLPGFTFHKALKARKTLLQTVEAILIQKKDHDSNDPNAKKGLIDLIKDEVEDEEGEKLDDKLFLIVFIFLFAGFETVGRAMTWATILLNQHPQVLQKAREEQEEIIKRRPSSQKGLTLSEIKQMKYLSKVIDETIRMRVGTFASPREAKKDTELNGYFIPKGWKVLVFQSAIHMDPEIYSNPNEFNPSRWDDFKPRAGTFHPFGAGCMACPGSDLSKILISIFLHYFILNYKLEQVNPGGPVIYLPAPDPIDNCLARIIKLR